MKTSFWSCSRVSCDGAADVALGDADLEARREERGALALDRDGLLGLLAHRADVVSDSVAAVVTLDERRTPLALVAGQLGVGAGAHVSDALGLQVLGDRRLGTVRLRRGRLRGAPRA